MDELVTVSFTLHQNTLQLWQEQDEQRQRAWQAATEHGDLHAAGEKEREGEGAGHFSSGGEGSRPAGGAADEQEEDVSGMSVSAIRQELHARGISTYGIFEKCEIVQALVLARAAGGW